MATYIKGADTYLPDIKPFTPDYKFLSAVLETKTDKYDANFKATNDLYNKVVYADLSREDTKERRDQYAETISPQIEKISGMDLSLQQNADAAKSVFAPFYEDDLTVKDIVYTANYRKQMAYANRLLDSPNQEHREKYWETGVRGLQYKMESFINDDAEKALQAEIPKYVDDADLAELANKILSEMDPPLKMKMDRFGTDKEGNPITDFIITEQNGRLVTGAALQVIQSTLMDDPRVQRAYHEQAFVAGRDFAKAGMDAGQFSSVEQGQEVWANETIKRINAINDQKIQEDVKEVNKLESANVRWENYKTSNGIIPGSDIDLAMQENLSVTEATQAALDKKMNLHREGNTPTKSIQGTLNKAYNMLMSANIGEDMLTAARNFSARDQEYTIRENKFAVNEKQFKYDMAKIRANAENDLILAEYKANRADGNTMLDKGYQYDQNGNLIRLPWADGPDPNNPLANLLQGNNVTFGDAGTLDVPVDDDGLPDQNADMIIRTKDQYLKADNKLMQRQVEDITNMMMLLNPTGDNASEGNPGDQTYSITLANGEEFRGTIQQVKEILLEPIVDEENQVVTGYTNRALVQDLFNEKSEEFKQTRQNVLNNPDIMLDKDQRNQYDNLYNNIFGLGGTVTQTAGVEQFITKTYEDYKKSYDLLETEVKGQDGDIKTLFDHGYPSLMGEDNIPLTKKQYLDLVVSKIQSGDITNPDLPGWDNGTSRSDYMHTVQVPTGNTYTVKTADGWEQRNEMKSVYQIDMDAVEHDAEIIYDGLYSGLNQYLTGVKGDVPSGDFNANVFGRGGTFSDVVSQPSYERNIDPMNPNPVGEAEMAHFILQMNKMTNEGKPFGMITGDIDDVEDIENLLVKDPLALRVYNMYKADLATWMTNPPKSGTSANVAPRAQIIYRPSYGPSETGDKTTAGYQLIFNADWLASKAKGSSSGTSVEFGSLKKSEILRLQGNPSDKDEITDGGIVFLFPQTEDINPKGSERQYYSFVETDISAAGNGYADYTVPDGVEPTANYRVIKVGNSQYKVHTKVRTYVPGGTYTIEENTLPIDMSFGLEGLDRAIQQLHQSFEMKREENRLAAQKDVAVNGEK